MNATARPTEVRTDVDASLAIVPLTLSHNDLSFGIASSFALIVDHCFTLSGENPPGLPRLLTPKVNAAI